MAGANPQTGKIAAGGAIAAIAAVLGFFALKPAPEPAPALTPPAAVMAPQAAPLPAKSTSVDLRFAIVPSPDGIVTLAGTAPPGLPVSIRLDGIELDRVTSLADGSFAAVLDIPAADLPRVLNVAAMLPDGSEILSRDVGFLPPSAPSVVAAAATAPAQPLAPIVLGSDGATVSAPAPADIPTAQVTLDAITYTPDGLVQFSGKGRPGDFVRLYLDGKFLMESGVRAEGQWFAEAGDVAPGTYSLRIDQIDSAGKVSARFETPFLRETAEALALAAGGPTAPGPTAPGPTAPGTAAPETAPAGIEPAAEPAGGEPANITAPPLAALPTVVIVQPGLTLWAIAKAELGDGVAYVQVFEANRDKIKDPDLIYPGQIFILPLEN